MEKGGVLFVKVFQVENEVALAFVQYNRADFNGGAVDVDERLVQVRAEANGAEGSPLDLLQLAAGDGILDLVELGDDFGRGLVNEEAVFGNEVFVVLVENFVAEAGRFPGGLLRFEKDIAVFFQKGDGDFLPTENAGRSGRFPIPGAE